MFSSSNVTTFSPEADAKSLYDAMKGAGTDEKAIIKLIANRTNAQRQQIKLFYKSSYGTDLIADLKSELGGNFETCVLALFDTPAEYDAKELYYAMKGAGTNEDTIIEIIATRSNSQLQAIKTAYKALFGNTLEEAITNETSSDFQRLLVSLLQCNRSEVAVADDDQAEVEANLLYQAGEGQWGTDESVFNKIFTLRSPAEIIAIAKKYFKMSGKTLFESIANEFSGDVRTLLTTLLQAIINPHEYFATRVNKAVKGWGTNDNLLIRVLVSRDEMDMPDIKKYYYTLYKRNMLDDIIDDTSGDYKDLLVEMASH